MESNELATALGGVVKFQCNICGAQCSVDSGELTREKKSCESCGSSVRTRAIIHILSHEFGRSLQIAEFPSRPLFRGIGMSDWTGYAIALESRLDYTNTFYHQEPFLDIANVDTLQKSKYDFIISTEVLEHVAPPVSRAFKNICDMLKPGGVLIMSVPYTLRGETREHFPKLHEFSILEVEGEKTLKNRTVDGKEELFDNLCFHGGSGGTLEMRIFSEIGVLAELRQASFDEIRIWDDPYLAHGILWPKLSSLPISARRPL